MSEPFHDHFHHGLDDRRWLPHYLPHWSSRAESAATWSVEDSSLMLSIPPDQGLWCADTHPGPLRVSGVQSGCYSGPVGSDVGQQPFGDGLLVREEQPLWTGWAPHGGLLEVTARMDLSPRSMASVWLVGLEDEPDRCGEICVFEVFGEAVDAGGAAIGQGVHPFRDTTLSEDFDAARHPVDPAAWHTYAADWRSDRVVFLVDGVVSRVVHQSPRYPMQMMIGVFDFPDRGSSDDDHVPRLMIDEVRGHP